MCYPAICLLELPLNRSLKGGRASRLGWAEVRWNLITFSSLSLGVFLVCSKYTLASCSFRERVTDGSAVLNHAVPTIAMSLKRAAQRQIGGKQKSRGICLAAPLGFLGASIQLLD